MNPRIKHGLTYAALMGCASAIGDAINAKWYGHEITLSLPSLLFAMCLGYLWGQLDRTPSVR